MHIAASAGRDEIVKALIAKGAHVNAVNQNGCTPLHYAASKNKQEVCIPKLLELVVFLEGFRSMKSTSSFPAPFSFNIIRLQSCFWRMEQIQMQQIILNPPRYTEQQPKET